MFFYLKRFVSVSVLLLLTAAPTFSAFAEGSKDMTKSGTGYRAHIEYTSEKVIDGDGATYISGSGNNKQELARKQIIQVYAREGETIYFGSSVSNSWRTRYDLDHRYSDNDHRGFDIEMTLPDGMTLPDSVTRPDLTIGGTTLNGVTTRNGKTVLGYDVLNTPNSQEGFIADYAMEQKGPSALFGDGGYDAFSFTVPQGGEGIYSFSFASNHHSDIQLYNGFREAGKPGLKKVTDPWSEAINGFESTNPEQRQGHGVAAWDITVADQNNKPLTGRVFADFLTMQVGTNVPGQDVINSKVYVLTQDGYLCLFDFNGLDPNGFLFFGNNLGLINLSTNSSFYHSSIYASNSFQTMQGGINIGFVMPGGTSFNDRNHNFRIFFNEPDKDIRKYLETNAGIPADPVHPAEAHNFHFDPTDTSSLAGDFTFETPKSSPGSCLYELMIRFPDDASRTVMLNGVCDSDGKTTVHWNGQDAAGKTVSTSETFTAHLKTKAGECHFILNDVEGCKNGIKLKLLNGSHNTSEDNYLTDKVYYDNSTIFVTTGNASTTLDFSSTDFALTGDAQRLDGVNSSKEPALQYTNGNGEQGYGNWRAFDVWTYFEHENFLTFPQSSGSGELTTISVSKVWPDAAAHSDFVLPASVTIRLLENGNDNGKSLTLTGKMDWTGSFTDLPKWDANGQKIRYTMQEDIVPGYRSVLKLQGDDYLIENHFQQEYVDISVAKFWADNLNQVHLRPGSISIILQENGKNTKEKLTLDAASHWKGSFDRLPKYKTDGTVVSYSIYEEPLANYVPIVAKTGDYAYQITNTLIDMPSTGDNHTLNRYAFLLFLSCLCCAYRVYKKRKAY